LQAAAMEELVAILARFLIPAGTSENVQNAFLFGVAFGF